MNDAEKRTTEKLASRKLLLTMLENSRKDGLPTRKIRELLSRLDRDNPFEGYSVTLRPAG